MDNALNLDDMISTSAGVVRQPGRLVTFGESYILLSTDGHDRLESANMARIAVGGPELNVAAAYACLGLEASWVSAVADSAFGSRKLRAARAANVDTQFVALAPGRSGLKFVDNGAQPREQSTLTDTSDSAFASRKSGKYDWDAILDGASALFVCGTTMGLSASVRQDAIDAMAVANQRGLIIAFDLDYRNGDWSEAEARRTFSGVVRHADVLFTDRPNLELFFGIDGSYDSVLRQAMERLGVAAIAMRRERVRGNGRIALEGLAMGKTGAMSISKTHTVEVVDSGGAADAFAAGFLATYLADPMSIARATEIGAAMSALVQTTSGEILVSSREEIETLAGV